MLKIHRFPAVRTQVSLILSILYYLPCRQGKSLDYVLACLVDKTVEKCNEKAVKSICRISHTTPPVFNLKPLTGDLNDELALGLQWYRWRVLEGKVLIISCLQFSPFHKII
jgi:hypothetical protein